MTQNKQTDLSMLLRELAVFLEANKSVTLDMSDHSLIAQSADEIERYYGGMLNWKKTAEDLCRPIDMVLHCPACHLQHIDAPDERTPEWKNEPHRSHMCHGCGHIWRPADVPTNGVKATQTKGKADSPATAHEAGRVRELKCVIADLTAECKELRVAAVAQKSEQLPYAFEFQQMTDEGMMASEWVCRIERKLPPKGVTVRNIKPLFDTPTDSASSLAVASAWIDEFGNVFPLGAYSPNGKPSWSDADKRGWKPLYKGTSIKLSSIPDGWKLVPIVPTPKMVDTTFNDRPNEMESHNKRNKRIYAAMIDAAPNP